MKSLLILICILMINIAGATDTVCLRPDYLYVFDRLKYSDHEVLSWDSAIISDLKYVVEVNESTCLKQMIHQHISTVEMDLSSLPWLSTYVQEASSILNVADQHRQLWPLLANVADIRLNELMNRLNSGIENGDLDPKAFEIKYAIQRLAELKYTISIKPGLWVKLVTYIKEGNWKHIQRSICTTHRTTFLKYAALVLLSLIVTVWTVRTFRKNYTLIIKIKQRHENSF